MARRAHITREQIVDAVVALVREEGHERLAARPLAARLGCSTQPILYHFATMREVEDAAYQAVDELHSGYITAGIEQSDIPLLALGVNYVRFAREEPRLFRFLFESGRFDATSLPELVEDPAAGQLIALVQTEAGLPPEAAQQVFMAIFVQAHGLASLLANNATPYDEQLVERLLLAAFVGATRMGDADDDDEAAG